MANIDGSGVIHLFGKTQPEVDSDARLMNQADTEVLERRLKLASDASARALELIEALRPHVDVFRATELPTLLLARLTELCNVAYDLTDGHDFDVPGCGIDDLEKAITVNNFGVGKES